MESSAETQNSNSYVLAIPLFITRRLPSVTVWHKDFTKAKQAPRNSICFTCISGGTPQCWQTVAYVHAINRPVRAEEDIHRSVDTIISISACSTMRAFRWSLFLIMQAVIVREPISCSGQRQPIGGLAEECRYGEKFLG